MVKSRLEDSNRNWMHRLEFVRICEEVYSKSKEGNQVAEMLDESGTVIVLGDGLKNSFFFVITFENETQIPLSFFKLKFL
ncbi:hypothetical protein LINPERHAP2_LOCUS68 [Linum perenne]